MMPSPGAASTSARCSGGCLSHRHGGLGCPDAEHGGLLELPAEVGADLLQLIVRKVILLDDVAQRPGMVDGDDLDADEGARRVEVDVGVVVDLPGAGDGVAG